MKKITYANGDSFVFGMEAVEDNSRSLDNKQLAFPRYIANHLQSETYINNAYCGATNEFIFRTTIIDLEALERQGHSPEDIFVIIGITSLHRIEIDGKNWIETSGRHVPNGTIGFSAGTPLSPIDWKINAETFPREFRDFGTIFVNPSSCAGNSKIRTKRTGVYPTTTYYSIIIKCNMILSSYFKSIRLF